MEKATRKALAKVAGKAAQIPFHGDIAGKESNLDPIIRFFPKWTLKEADGSWCAAFVYYCCREAGFEFPIRPDACKTCHLAGCIAWEEFATGDARIGYYKGGEGFVPEAGDIVLYDRVFENREHDHIGIVIENRGDMILTAEGNIANRSGIIERPKDEHIRGYIRIPDGYKYRRMNMDYRTERMEGGTMLDYQIVKKASFTIVGVKRRFHSDTSYQEIPKFWDEWMAQGEKRSIMGTFGVCLDMDGKDFDYWIADLYFPWEEIPAGCETRVIPAGVWAQFSCTIDTLQDTNTKIWSEWLPALQGYSLAGDYDIEVYFPPMDGKEEMTVAIWVPLKKD